MTADECCGWHIKEAKGDYRRVDWDPVRPRVDRVRVRAHTCDCRPVFYEFCQAAGLMFIRRTTREKGQTQVHESPWMLARDAEMLWELLRHGRAR